MTNKPSNDIYCNLEFQLKVLHQVLNNGDKKIDLLFLKNRSPRLESNIMAKVSHEISNGNELSSLLNKEIYYSQYPLWERISQNDDLTHLSLRKDQAPFQFTEPREVLLSAVKHQKYQWGLLIAIGDQDIQFSKEELKVIRSFCLIFASTIHQNLQFTKSILKLEKDCQIKNQGRIRRDQKPDSALLSDLQNKIRNSNHGSLNWQKDQSNIDEIWLSVQAYEKGKIDPVKSSWIKIDHESQLEALNFQLPQHGESLSKEVEVL